MTNNHSILWADDEIDLLKPHVMFLKAKGYTVATVNNGADALEMVKNNSFDLIILDENMPGLTGLETLQRIKIVRPSLPVIMITKSEEENIMDQAVGSKIADYLIKPVNPSQILISIKKILHSSELVNEKSTSTYRQNFMEISHMTADASTMSDWMELYRMLTHWEIELSTFDTGMDMLLKTQKEEANAAFSKFIIKNYESWMDPDNPERPLLSPDLFKKKIIPELDSGNKLYLVIIDNFRLDQWRTISPLLTEFFTIDDDSLCCSILPTATQYARNAIFSGLMPAEIRKMYPDLWVDEESDDGKNNHEARLVATQLERFRRNYRFSYNKINDSTTGQRFLRNISSLNGHDLNIVVMNFIDMLSHARTDSKMIRELAPSHAAYRSLTLSWFRHSPAFDIFRQIAAKGYKVIITSDHGTVQVNRPVKIAGERNVNTNLRYKIGRNLGYNLKEVYEVKRPQLIGLPSAGVASNCIFATGNDFFAYHNKYNHYVQYYNGTYQHGGISLEEMLVPAVTLSPRK